MPIVRTQLHNYAVSELIQSGFAIGAGGWAWLGFSDEVRETPNPDGGGWLWADGVPVGRGHETGGGFYPGFSAWGPQGGNVDVLPWSEYKCGYIDDFSNWWPSSCADTADVICCYNTGSGPASCPASGADWPLVPLLVGDNPVADDVPNTVAEIAAGFETKGAYYIGNQALAGMTLTAAELCFGDSTAAVELCMALESEMYEYTNPIGGPELDGSSGLHKIIAALSGQVPPGKNSGAVDGNFVTYTTGKNIVPTFEDPDYCFIDPVNGPFNEPTKHGLPIPCSLCAIDTTIMQLDRTTGWGHAENFGNIWQARAGDDGHWAVAGGGMTFFASSQHREFAWGLRGQNATCNGVLAPWTYFYVRAKGRPGPPISTAPRPRCPPTRRCDTSRSTVECIGDPQLVVVPDFENDRANSVILRDNGIERVTSSAFEGLQDLITLDLSGNVIIVVSARSFAALEQLEVLDLSSNYVSQLPEFLFEGLSRLRRIDLRSNRLREGIIPALLSGLASLEIFAVADNLLDSWSSPIFDGLTTVTTLELGLQRSSAKLVDATTLFRNLDSLKAIEIDELARKMLLGSNMFVACVLLTDVSINSNGITLLPRGLFAHSPQLEYFRAADNKITAVPEEFFNHTAYVRTIDLSGNLLTAIAAQTFVGLPKLETLLLENNRITSIDSGTFLENGALLTITLSLNTLTRFPVNMFASTAPLSTLTITSPDDTNVLTCPVVDIRGTGEKALDTNRCSCALPDESDTQYVLQLDATFVKCELKLLPGSPRCSSEPDWKLRGDAGCTSARCRHHCCDLDVQKGCELCDSNGGCYAPLALVPTWEVAAGLGYAEGWVGKLDQGELHSMQGLAPGFAATYFVNLKGRPSDVQYRMAWSESYTNAAVQNHPPNSLAGEAEGFDPGIIVVDPSTADVVAVPRDVGRFIGWLIAVDTSGSAAARGLPNMYDELVIKRWVFDVVPVTRLNISSEWDSHRLDTNMLSRYALDVTYRIPEPSMAATNLFVDVADNDLGSIRYSLNVVDSSGADAADKGEFLASRAGACSLRVFAAGSYHATLEARDSDSAVAVVRSWQFLALSLDPSDPSNGPRGRACKFGHPVDGTEFDRNFTCDCTGTDFTGANCDESKATSSPGMSAQSTQTFADDAGDGTVSKSTLVPGDERILEGVPSTVSPSSRTGQDTWELYQVVAVVGIIALLMCAMLVAVRSLKDRKNRTDKGIDMEGLQAEVLEVLGLKMPRGIPDGAVCFGLRFRALPPGSLTLADRTSVFVHAGDGHVLGIADDGTEFESQLIAAIVTATKEYELAIKVDGAKVCQGENDRTAMISIPRPPDAGPDYDDALAGILGTKIAQGLLVVAGHCAEELRFKARVRAPQEIARSNLSLISVLSEGSLCEVWEGRVTDDRMGLPLFSVAIKMVKANKSTGYGADLTKEEPLRAEHEHSMLREAALCGALSHANLVGLVGVVTTPRSLPAMVLTEFCEHGPLDKFVSGKSHLPISMRLSMCADAARGLSFLEARCLVHRDVAARNVLVDSALFCKVADFASAATSSGPRNGESATSWRAGVLPIRWASVEVLSESRYSPASDVWAFGVLVYEVMSFGTVPFGDKTMLEIVEFVKAGGMLSCPTGCPSDIYRKVMMPCWHFEPCDRPTFGQVLGTLSVSIAEVAGATGPGARLNSIRSAPGGSVAHSALGIPARLAQKAMTDNGTAEDGANASRNMLEKLHRSMYQSNKKEFDTARDSGAMNIKALKAKLKRMLLNDDFQDVAEAEASLALCSAELTQLKLGGKGGGLRAARVRESIAAIEAILAVQHQVSQMNDQAAGSKDDGDAGREIPVYDDASIGLSTSELRRTLQLMLDAEGLDDCSGAVRALFSKIGTLNELTKSGFGDCARAAKVKGAIARLEAIVVTQRRLEDSTVQKGGPAQELESELRWLLERGGFNTIEEVSAKLLKSRARLSKLTAEKNGDADEVGKLSKEIAELDVIVQLYDRLHQLCPADGDALLNDWVFTMRTARQPSAISPLYEMATTEAEYDAAETDEQHQINQSRRTRVQEPLYTFATEDPSDDDSTLSADEEHVRRFSHYDMDTLHGRSDLNTLDSRMQTLFRQTVFEPQPMFGMEAGVEMDVDAESLAGPTDCNGRVVSPAESPLPAGPPVPPRRYTKSLVNSSIPPSSVHGAQPLATSPTLTLFEGQEDDELPRGPRRVDQV